MRFDQYTRTDKFLGKRVINDHRGDRCAQFVRWMKDTYRVSPAPMLRNDDNHIMFQILVNGEPVELDGGVDVNVEALKAMVRMLMG